MNDTWPSGQHYDLLNHVPVGVCIVSRQLEVLFWNINMEFWLGIESAEIVGRKLTDFFPKFGEMRYAIRLARVFEGGAPEVFSSQLHTSLFLPVPPGVHPYVHHTNVSAIARADGLGNDAMISVEDVTESTRRSQEQRRLKEQALREVESRKEAETRLRASQEQLMALNATKDRIFSIIAHDMREPLSSIVNFFELVMENPGDFDTSELVVFFRELHTGATSLLALLENLLTWARSQTGQIRYAPEVVDLVPVFESALALLGNSAARKKIDMPMELPEPCLAYCDVNMMGACVRNLLSNAIKFTQPGGRVSIGWLGAVVDPSGRPCIEVAVSDTGVGMTEEQVGRLFHMDSSFSTLGTSGEKGTGIGLILCHEFITRNGGSLRVESKPGQGSRFILRLPAAP